jgi:hypothetical protein
MQFGGKEGNNLPLSSVEALTIDMEGEAGCEGSVEGAYSEGWISETSYDHVR